MIRSFENNATVCGFSYRLLAAGRTQGFHILMYHRLLDQPDPYDFHATATPIFEAQLAMLSRYCAVLSLDEIIDRIERRRPLPRRCVALTFDDGYRSLLTHAWPLLERYRLPSLLYVAIQAVEHGFLWPDLLRYAMRTTGQSHLELETLADGEPASFPLAAPAARTEFLRSINGRLKKIDDQRKNNVLIELCEKLLGCAPGDVRIPGLMLSWDELKELASRGLEVGAHTITHPILTRVSRSECEREVARSVQTLKEKLGKPVSHFAYPNGQRQDYSPEVRSVVQATGVRSACTAIAGSNHPAQDLFALYRLDGNRKSVWDLMRNMSWNAN